MTISSRTPEGQPNRCPLCRADVCIEHSVLFGDATCPKCGTLLWFVGNPSEPILIEYASSQAIRERLLQAAAERLSVEEEQLWANPSLLDDLNSLDTVELIMELEEELGRQ